MDTRLRGGATSGEPEKASEQGPDVVRFIVIEGALVALAWGWEAAGGDDGGPEWGPEARRGRGWPKGPPKGTAPCSHTPCWGDSGAE